MPIRLRRLSVTWSSRASRSAASARMPGSSSRSRPGLVLASDRTAPARRTCSRRCTSARRGSRRARAPTRSSIRFGESRGSRGRTWPARRDAARARGDARARERQAGERERRSPAARPSSCAARRPTLVFTPDRLGDRQGRPGRSPRLLRPGPRPALAGARSLPPEYGAAVAQRNAALRRVPPVSPAATRSHPGRSRSPRSARSSSRPGGRRSPLLGSPASPNGAAELGLGDGRLATRASRRPRQLLEERLERDLERGVTGLGPHLDDVALAPAAASCAASARRASSGSRCSRSCSPRRSCSPIAAVCRRCSCSTTSSRSSIPAAAGCSRPGSPSSGQTLVTATDAATLPVEPDQLLEVVPGDVRETAA